MATTKTIAQIVEQIKTAIFGKDVRTNLADGIEKCYDDVTAGVTVANAAATKIDGLTVAANELNPGSAPTATISEVSGHKHIAFGIPKGLKGDKGDTGEPFYVVKTYASISAMTADFSGTDTSVGDYVMIVCDPALADNGKVYRKGASSWEFLADISGPKGDTGAKGDKGNTGDTPVFTAEVVGTVPYDQRDSASVTVDSTDEHNPILQFVLPQGPTGSVGSIKGSDIPVSSSDTRKIDAAISSLASTKANRPNSATSGNFASLDNAGNITDSGHKHADYLTKMQSYTAGNFVSVNAIGNLQDSGKSANDFVTQQQVEDKIADKVDKDDAVQDSFDGNVSPAEYSEGSFVKWNGHICAVIEDINEGDTVNESILPRVSSIGGVANILSNRIDALNSMPLIIIKTYSTTYSISAKGYKVLKASEFKDSGNNPITCPDGYIPLCFYSVTTSSSNACIYGFNLNAIFDSGVGLVSLKSPEKAVSDSECKIRVCYIRILNIINDSDIVIPET